MVQSATVDVFFSCSFAPVDKDVNDYFMAICRALNFQLVNVSTGSSKTPPEVAREKITQSQAVVAVCTQRSELKGGKFVMPDAVHQEISIAFGCDTPVLMIVEDGVEFAGFKSGYGTYLSFDRLKLSDPAFLQQAVEAIHNLKMDALGDVASAVPGFKESHADFVNHLVELKDTAQGLIWKYSTTKKIVYTQASKRSIPVGVWASAPVRDTANAPNMNWAIRLRDSSRGIRIEETIEKHTADRVDARLKLNPSAEEGDFIEYLMSASSPYLNPIWLEDVDDGPHVHLNGGAFKCSDGLIFIHRTKKAVIEFRIHSESGLTKADVTPFVGAYAQSVDYEVESELERANLKVEDFGDSFTVRMEIDSPLPAHMYGIAWNPKPRPCGEEAEEPRPELAD